MRYQVCEGNYARMGITKDKDSVIFTFEGEKEHIEEYYKKAKVFLFSSDAEGFGMVLNEAGCFGVAVVAKYYLYIVK